MKASCYIFKALMFAAISSCIFGTAYILLFGISSWIYLLCFVCFFATYVVVDAVEMILERMS